MKCLIWSGLLFPLFLSGQRLDHFDLLLFSLTNDNGVAFSKVEAPRFLTAFNPKGYNNQPAFFSAGEIYLSAQLPTDTSQTDIYALDLGARSMTRVTATREAEYSPAPMPGSGRRFSAVRVEADGSQRLWSFPLDRSDMGRPVFPNLAGVGYYCWLRDTMAALFMVGENGAPHTLVLAGFASQKPERIATNIGRCLLKTPDGRLAFIQKNADRNWFLKTYDPQKNALEIIAKAPSDSEDFAVLPDGAYLCGSGSKLYQFRPGQDTDWRLLADLSKYGVSSITRLAVSKEGKLVVVVQ